MADDCVLGPRNADVPVTIVVTSSNDIIGLPIFLRQKYREIPAQKGDNVSYLRFCVDLKSYCGSEKSIPITVFYQLL